MIPLRDDNPTVLWPIVTIVLIVANAAVFLYELSLDPISPIVVGVYPMRPVSRA